MEICSIENHDKIHYSIVSEKKSEESEINPNLDEPEKSKQMSPFQLFTEKNSLSFTKSESIYDRLEKAIHNEKKVSPAVYAIENKDYELLKLLIDLREDLENAAPYTPCYMVSSSYNDDRLYFHGYQPAFRPLEYAIKTNDLQAIQILLEYDSDHQAEVNVSRVQYLALEADGYWGIDGGYGGYWGVSGDKGAGYCLRNGHMRTESVLELANRTNCDPEIIYLLMKHHPHLANIAESYRAPHQLSFLSTALQVMYEKWKNESIAVDGDDLLKIAECSLQSAIQDNDKQLVITYIKYGWKIQSTDLLVAIDNPDLLNELLMGNVEPLASLEVLIEQNADWKVIEAQMDRIDNLDIEELVQKAIKGGHDQLALLLMNNEKLEIKQSTDGWLLDAVVHNCSESLKEILSRKQYTENGLLEARRMAYQERNYVFLELLTNTI